MARGGKARSSRIDIDVELVAGRDWTSERLKQAEQQSPIGAPHALRTQFDDAVDVFEGSQKLELPIKCKNWRTKTHFISLEGVLGQIGIDPSGMQCFHGRRVAAGMGKYEQNGPCAQRAGRLHEVGGKREASARAICPGRCRGAGRRERALATVGGSSRRTRLRSHRGGGARAERAEP